MGFWSIVGQVMREADFVLFVLDARMPELSWNKRIEELAIHFHKQLLPVFTKIDLVSEEQLQTLHEKYPDAFFVSGTKNRGLKQLKTHLLIEGKRFGIMRPKIGVVGYPNVGKSAIINALAHRARAAVSPKAGTTRGIQFVKAGSLKVLDSPGVIPYEDEEHKLALIAAKNPEKLRHPERVAVDIIRLLLKEQPAMLAKLCGGVCTSEEPYEILEQIGKHRGFLKKGGAADEAKTAIALVREWQRGKLRI